MTEGRWPLTLELFPAGHGDCLLLECAAEDGVRRVLIDCGTAGTAKHLAPRIAALPEAERRFELLVVTHIDADHIGGVPKILEDGELDVSFEDVWFNGLRHLPSPTRGPAQGEALTAVLDGDAQRFPWNRRFDGGAVATAGDGQWLTVDLDWGLSLTLLSPTPERLRALWPQWNAEVERVHRGVPSDEEPQEPAPALRSARAAPSLEALAGATSKNDTKAPNGSSIALLAEFAGRSVLLAGDAFPDVLAAAVRSVAAARGAERLTVDACKLPHHGSQGNIDVSFLESLDCRRWLFSTNGSYFDHPDPEAVARVILHGGDEPELVFNYRSEETERWDDGGLRERHGFRTVFPAPGEAGIAVSI